MEVFFGNESSAYFIKTNKNKNIYPACQCMHAMRPQLPEIDMFLQHGTSILERHRCSCPSELVASAISV